MSRPSPRKRSLPDYQSLSKSWLQTAESVLADDRQNYNMLALLFKKYGKQRLDYESLLNAVEELLPRGHMRELLSHLAKLFKPVGEVEDASKAEVEPPVNSIDTKIYRPSIIIMADDNTCELEIPTSKLVRSTRDVRKYTPKKAIPTNLIIDTRNRAITPPVTESDPETRSIEDIAVKYPFTPQDSPKPADLIPSRFLKIGTDLASTVQYIVASLGRHSESIVLVPDDPIPEFQAIIDKSDGCQYFLLHEFQKDMDYMMKILIINGHEVDKICKHYEYLVGYYFPAQINGGRKRKVVHNKI